MEICGGGSAGVTNCCYAAKPLSPIPEDPQKTAIQMESTKKMFQLIESRLPKREAEVVVQRYGYGLSITDTAEKMNVNKRLVSRYLSLALKKMREFVPKNEDGTI